MSILETAIQNLQGIADTISMIIQYALHTLNAIRYFLRMMVDALYFVYQAFGTLPLFFVPVVMVVLGVMVVRALLGRE